MALCYPELAGELGPAFTRCGKHQEKLPEESLRLCFLDTRELQDWKERSESSCAHGHSLGIAERGWMGAAGAAEHSHREVCYSQIQ